MLPTEEKQKIIKSFQRSEGDTGSPEVQIALLSNNINALQSHFAMHKKDFHSKRGLIRMVEQRRKMLNYLKRRNVDNYTALIGKLGLRQ